MRKGETEKEATGIAKDREWKRARLPRQTYVVRHCTEGSDSTATRRFLTEFQESAEGISTAILRQSCGIITIPLVRL